MKFNRYGHVYHKTSNEIPQWMREKIARIEYMFRRYYGDELTKFTGTTKHQAEAWFEEVEDEYRGICDELHHGRMKARDFNRSV